MCGFLLIACLGQNAAEAQANTQGWQAARETHRPMLPGSAQAPAFLWPRACPARPPRRSSRTAPALDPGRSPCLRGASGGGLRASLAAREAPRPAPSALPRPAGREAEAPRAWGLGQWSDGRKWLRLTLHVSSKTCVKATEVRVQTPPPTRNREKWGSDPSIFLCLRLEFPPRQRDAPGSS